MKFNLIYTGKRLGKNEKPFHVYKFRTMILNADELLPQIKNNKERNGLGKFKNDPRVTKIGGFLRRYGLDELPQIWNIIRGEMTIVGIRPRNLAEWKYYSKDHKALSLKFKPGLFSPAYSKVSISNHEALEAIEKEYLLKKLNAPITTDFKYFWLILWGILNGARSA